MSQSNDHYDHHDHSDPLNPPNHTGVYADINAMHNAAKLVADVHNEMTTIHDILQPLQIDPNMFGNFPLARRCADLTITSHMEIMNSLADQIARVEAIHRKMMYCADELVTVDENNAELIGDSGTSEET